MIKNADAKGLIEIAREPQELAGKARDGKLTLGADAGRHVHDLVDRRNRRHGLHADRQRARGRDSRRDAHGDETGLGRQRRSCPRLMLPISVSYDHRVIDGAGAARFLVYVAELLADFRRVML